ncbi:FAD/NAD(P)-binding domain-containing protein [Rhizoclosmatium globosum]|uniref:FAD/NAD(P)-binding domain-containing protein n=1 Tax=Rhizoclosmatium globosum TaxID=329046 RepID=A0A1Y2CDI7_9FUNG|nr:FAD/NAD(P)-binding domain-containing protein [Rhizoclosmatium globosum]|eukprot:ORY45120.1 FAD/NAD(P)-binding domain-containing protein [Rhizoclosmatium globosum]
MIFALQDGSDRNTRTLAKPGDIEPLHVLRSEFHAILMKAAYTHGIKTLAGKKFVSLQEKGPEVVINFADGSLVTADFVIGADGVHSAVRKCIFPDAPLPIVCGRGFVGEVELGQYANGITAQFDDPKALHMDPIGGNSFYHCTYAPNSVSFDIISFNHPDQQLPLDSNANTDWSPVKNLSEERGNLARDVESWGFKRNIVDNIRVAKQLTPLIVLDLPDLPQYYSSRVVLIGDAAHGILPTNGQGLNLALEDAGTLGDLFGHFKNAQDPVPRVFELYERFENRMYRA